MNSPRDSMPTSARRRRALPALAGALMAACACPPDVFAHSTVMDYASLSLEELMNEIVTSVSKREQKLTEAAAAVTVLSNDDIRRSGATSVAEALRLVPGMSVAAVDSGQWAISARGFGTVFSNKQLVLVDGRAVYSPLFAGVHWDAVQPVLEDVDRIEVIRGPGATVWGANAVNGVINVVTRSARDTQGGLLYASAGDVQQTDSGVRYGGRVGERTYYRVDAGTFAKNDYLLPDGESADDSWYGNKGGFRIDHHTDGDAQLTWLGGVVDIDTHNDATQAYNVHTLGRLTKEFSDRSGVEVQAYYDRMMRDEDLRLTSWVDTFDVSAQQTFGVGERNDVIWGLGWRVAQMSVRENNFSALVRDREVDSQLFSFFVQDEFRLVPDRLTLTAGVKVEHNDYTGVEVQPSVRAVLKATDTQTFWGAVSRAVRTPAAFEASDLYAILAGPPFAGPGGVYVPRIVGNPDLKSEDLLAYELGYRVQPTTRVSVDLALFYNDYDDMVGLENLSGFVPGVPVGTAEIPFGNTRGGRAWGGELGVTYSPMDTWRLGASYSLLIVDLSGSAPANPYERASARNQIVVRSSHDLTHRLTFDAQFRYVDTIQGVPAYFTADLRLAYRITDQLECSLVGQNLLDNHHPEQAPFYLTSPSEVPRGFYGKLTWRF